MSKAPCRKVAVIGSDEDLCAATDIQSTARAVGRALAEAGLVVMTGGGGGVMAAAVEGAKEVRGMTVAFTPGVESDADRSGSHMVLPTGTGWGGHSLALIRAADAVVALGGGAGTLLELCLAYLHEKKIFAFATHGGWSARLQSTGMTGLDERNFGEIRYVAEVRDLMEAITLHFAGDSI